MSVMHTPVNNIIFRSEDDARKVEEAFNAIFRTDKAALVADLLALCGLPSTYVDVNWGWKEPQTFELEKISSGVRAIFSDPLPVQDLS